MRNKRHFSSTGCIYSRTGRYSRNRIGVTSFSPSAAGGMFIYVCKVREHPDKVKVGRTGSWKNRSLSYKNWNLSNGDGMECATVFELNEEYIDLPALESYIINSIPFDKIRNEWFIADYDEVVDVVRDIMFSCEISYSVEIHQ